jgi:hypothetical protein
MYNIIENVFKVPANVERTLKICKKAYQDMWNANSVSQIDDIVTQLTNHLETSYVNIGVGSSRTVYRVNNHLVLKVGLGHSFFDHLKSLKKNIAKHSVADVPVLQDLLDMGTAQNGAELAATTSNCIDREIIAGVVKYTPDMFALVSEYASDINASSFASYSGISWKEFSDLMLLLSQGEQWHKKYVAEKLKSGGKKSFLYRLYTGIKRCNLEPADFTIASHFGIIGDRLVILDYGFTSDVRKSFYTEACDDSSDRSEKMAALKKTMIATIKSRMSKN